MFNTVKSLHELMVQFKLQKSVQSFNYVENQINLIIDHMLDKSQGVSEY